MPVGTPPDEGLRPTHYSKSSFGRTSSIYHG
jgi:hypothetical protein